MYQNKIGKTKFQGKKRDNHLHLTYGTFWKAQYIVMNLGKLCLCMNRCRENVLKQMGDLTSPPAILIQATVRRPLAESMWTSEPGKEPSGPIQGGPARFLTIRLRENNPLSPKQWHNSFLKYTVWQWNRTFEIRTIFYIQGFVIHKHQQTTRNFFFKPSNQSSPSFCPATLHSYHLPHCHQTTLTPRKAWRRFHFYFDQHSNPVEEV